MNENQLFLAIQNNRLSEIQAMNLSPMDLNEKIMSASSGDMDALHVALTFNRHAIVEYLIDFGADVNSKGMLGKTILFELVSKVILVLNKPYERNIWMNLLKLLLEKGANPNIPDMHGCSPLKDAKIHRDLEVCDLLEAYGAKGSLV